MTPCMFCALDDCPRHEPRAGVGARGTKQATALIAQQMVDELFRQENETWTDD